MNKKKRSWVPGNSRFQVSSYDRQRQIKKRSSGPENSRFQDFRAAAPPKKRSSVPENSRFQDFATARLRFGGYNGLGSTLGARPIRGPKAESGPCRIGPQFGARLLAVRRRAAGGGAARARPRASRSRPPWSGPSVQRAPWPRVRLDPI